MPKASKSKVHFFSQGLILPLRNRKKLRLFISSLLRKEGKKLEAISFVFLSDKKLLEINRKYLSHNTYTDILTFNLSDNKGEIFAEIYISLDRVRENSKTFSTSLSNELHRVIFHGVLHLCGYKDKSKEEKKEMRKKEELYLFRYFK